MSALAESVAKHPFASGLSAEHQRVLVGCAMGTKFRKGQLIFELGDLANRFYLIQTGKLVLESPVADSGWLAVQTVGPGEVLGWSWLFEPYRCHFRARAIAPTSAIFFYGTRLQMECEQDPSLGYELVKRMAQLAIKRLENTQQQLLDFWKLERQRKQQE